MKNRRVSLSELAVADIFAQADWYEAQANLKLAMRWEKSVSVAVLRLAKTPYAGALCRFESPELAGTRWFSIPGFPKHLLFYQVRGNSILILRVVHGVRDLEPLFS